MRAMRTYAGRALQWSLAGILCCTLLLFPLLCQADTVNLAWDPNTEPDIAKYRIYRGTSQGGPYTQIGEVAHPTVGFSDVNAQKGVTYFYVGTALDGFDNESINSNEVSTTIVPAVPGAVAASDGVHVDRVSVNWGNVTGETGYKVFRATAAGGTYTQIGATAANTTAYDDPQACGGTPFYYKVSAANSGGDSALSTSDAGSTASCPAPPVPQNIAASDGASPAFVTITWNASAGADDYQVYRSDTVGGAKTALGSWQAGLSRQDSTGTQGTTYQYWVKARASGVESDFGGPDAGFRTAAEVVTAPDAPTGPPAGFTTLSYSFAVSGGSSSYGDSVQYLFDWGDGTQSPWLPAGTATASKTWSSEGTYAVKVQARCVDHTGVVSAWSATLSVAISKDDTAPAAMGNLKIGSL